MFATPEVQYEIDVTQAKGNRIKGLTYKGRPMNATQDAVIACQQLTAPPAGAAFYRCWMARPPFTPARTPTATW